jgi:phospholipid/cholesterol/gamma-HCH transport system substrate-binding protein
VSRTLSGLQALVLGAVVLVGLGLIGVAVFAVGSRQWFWNDALHVRAGFASVQGVEVGTRVRIRGMDAGEVLALEAPASAEGQVMLRLRIQGKFRHLVRQDATVQIVSVGMLGAKAVEVQPGTEGRPLAENDALLASRAGSDLTDLAGVASSLADEAKPTLRNIEKAAGRLDTLARKAEDTLESIKRSADAVERVPIVGGFLENPRTLLVRPRHEKHRQLFREQELFEPGRAALTSNGRVKLDRLEDWLEGLKAHAGADVVVVAYADPAPSPDAAHAKRITDEQSREVVDYLKKQFKVHKRGWIPWYHKVKVTPLGMGVNPPPEPEAKPLPLPRIEVLVFVPQS